MYQPQPQYQQPQQQQQQPAASPAPAVKEHKVTTNSSSSTTPIMFGSTPVVSVRHSSSDEETQPSSIPGSRPSLRSSSSSRPVWPARRRERWRPTWWSILSTMSPPPSYHAVSPTGPTGVLLMPSSRLSSPVRPSTIS